ncbi:medium-chain acyl-CoA ligase ACSF2, mitochondrial-like [Lineus longissimus]|uniref:medium-chain acyl-CoA ligase ACSF2, mitochondrial-like n=1 Tax=Lineus longissimus TaxID=88925 RepID=UPI00315D75AF
MMAAQKLRSYHCSNSGVPPLQHSLPELLDIRGDANPDKEAYVVRDIGVPRQAITFGEMKLRTQQLAAAFIAHGLKKGERVSLMCPTSIDYVVCEYAIARTGGILVRLQSSFKTEQDLKYLLGKSGAKWIIAQPGHNGKNYELFTTICPGLRDHDPKMKLGVEGLPDLEKIFILGEEPYEGTILLKSITSSQKFDLKELYQRQTLLTNDDIQGLNMTSGSTGYPKLVAQPYAYGINGWRNASMMNGITDRDIYITDRPMPYSGGMTGPAFGIGYTMVYVVTKASVGAGSEGSEFMLQCAEEEKCTVLLTFPYLLTDLVQLAQKGKFNAGKVRVGIFGGQSVNSALFTQCLNVIPNLLNMYGSSESNIPVGALLQDSVEKRASTTGIAVDGEAKIVDEAGDIVPVNTDGELCVRLKSLFVKYWGDDELTKQVKTADGWFLTADRAVMDHEGYITIKGRKQEIISRATVKIYPLTLENVIIKHPKITLVIVVGVPDARLYEEICACVVPHKDKKMTEAELREYCDGIFGECEDGLSLGPKYFVLLDSLPYGPTGKVDRRKVRKIAIEQLGMDTM